MSFIFVHLFFLVVQLLNSHKSMLKNSSLSLSFWFCCNLQGHPNWYGSVKVNESHHHTKTSFKSQSQKRREKEVKTAVSSPLLPDRTGQAPCPCWSAQTHWPGPWLWPCPLAGRHWGSCRAGPPSPPVGRLAWVCAAPGEDWWASGFLSSTLSLASLLLNLVCGVRGSVKKHYNIYMCCQQMSHFQL